MLFPPNPQQLNSEPPGSNTTAATAEAAASTATTATTTTAENLQDTNGNNADHDMETDDNAIPVLSSPGVVQERANQRGREYYIERDSAASKVLKSHRHRNYAGYPSLYYSHNHNHNHYTLRHHLHYNPLTHRKFPPYQYWAASAQRNYHLSTIGILPQCSPEIGRYSGAAGQEFLKIAESTILAIAGGRPPPGVGDRILRTSTRNGGVNKSAAYPSRLPVHFRHMTSRTNRRPAICVNPFQGDNSTTSSSSTTNQQLRQQGHRGEEGHGGSTAVAKTKTSTAGSKAISGVLPLFSGLSIEDSNVQSDSTSSSSLSAVGRSIDSSSSASNRKKLTVDWKRVTAFSIDLEGDSQRSSGSEMVMRLSSNGSVTDSKASSIGGSSAKGTGSGRHWASQRGGLANLLQVKQSQDGSTVDRLVEEMNKWSV
ncbi:hypothetical protein BGX27_001617 [Mortierella sp. AM989]|nr:hypothetical protein BGX27_001617 [Mortierella sp. AM989]